MIEIKSYDLKDYSIFNSENESDFLIWQPDKTYIILGRSNRVAEDSVHLARAVENGIAIYKRPSGGEAVILSPNTLVISVKLPLNNEIKTHHYFREPYRFLHYLLRLYNKNNLKPDSPFYLNI